MKSVVWANACKKDYKRITKRGLSLDKFKNIVMLLASDATLPDSARPHKLSGNYAQKWECHIEPDWLLIYEYAENEIILLRTGTHSDLFR